MENSSAVSGWSALAPLLALPLAAALCSGCEGPREARMNSVSLTDEACPSEYQDQVTVTSSSVPVSIPREIALAAPSPNAQEILGRRILLSVAPGNRVRKLHVFSSALSITTIGGTFAGWAKLEATSGEDRSLEIIPGRIRVRPFLRALREQTTTLDALIAPGAVPVDEMTMMLPPLWDEAMRPVRPQELHLTLTAARHYTVFDVVSATVTLDVVLGESRRSRHRWTCSFANRLQLVSREDSLPTLWGLTNGPRNPPARSWVALYEATTGPIRAVFSDPASAQGFARWLRQTAATRAGPYQLGWVAQEDEELRSSNLQRNRSTVGEFRALTPQDLSTVSVGRLGEP